LNGFKINSEDMVAPDSVEASDLNGDKAADANDDDDDDPGKDRPRFRDRATPPFFSFPFPAGDESRHAFKDRALNLAMEFNGDRGRRGVQVFILYETRRCVLCRHTNYRSSIKLFVDTKNVDPF
jgi:hypothetical protein